MRRPTPALVISCLALFVALGGTAIAAHDYLITSKGQIAPKVLKALRGEPGPAGPQGPAGPVGKTGATGAAGKDGADGKNGVDGTNGVEGKPGPPGSARAWGTVSSAGSFEPIGDNFIAAQKVATGVYCVSFGSSIAPNNSVVFAMPVYGGHKVFMQYDPGSNHECTAAHSFAIEAHGASGNLEDTSFYVMVP